MRDYSKIGEILNFVANLALFYNLFILIQLRGLQIPMHGAFYSNIVKWHCKTFLVCCTFAQWIILN